MKGLAVACAVLPGRVVAQSISCVMADGTPVAFEIDQSQFVDPVSPHEPIMRRLSFVQMGAARFPAEPFIIGPARGFHAEALGGASIMFVVQPDGTAILANATTGASQTGICEGM